MLAEPSTVLAVCPVIVATPVIDDVVPAIYVVVPLIEPTPVSDEEGWNTKLPDALSEPTPDSDDEAPFVFCGVADIDPTPLIEAEDWNTEFDVALTEPTATSEAEPRNSVEPVNVAVENALALALVVRTLVAFPVIDATPVKEDDDNRFL